MTFLLLLFFSSSSSSSCDGAAGGGGAVAGAPGSLGVALPGPVLQTWLALDLVLTCFEAKLHSNGSKTTWLKCILLALGGSVTTRSPGILPTRRPCSPNAPRNLLQ